MAKRPSTKKAAKPVMSAREASWHAHMAGERERAKQNAQPDQDDKGELLADVALGERKIAGFILQPSSAGTMACFRKAARLFPDYVKKNGIKESPFGEAEPGEYEFLEMGMAILIFLDAESIWAELRGGEITDAIAARALELIWNKPIADYYALRDYVQGELGAAAVAMNGGEPVEQPEPGKPEARGTSNESDNPQPTPPPH